MRANRSPLARPVSYDEALITSFCRYGESDCVVKLFTRQKGRLSAFFKRGLAVGKLGQGAIQAPGLARVGLLPGNDQQLLRMVSVDMDPRCFVLASSLKLFGYCSYIAELLEKLLPEHEPAVPIFDMVVDTFAALVSHGAQAYVLRAYELKLLEYLGYLPEIPSPQHDFYYDPLACRFSLKLDAPAFIVSSSALRLALGMLALPVGAQANVSQPELLMIGRIFHSRLKLLGVLPLKSLTFFKQVSLSQK